jgi:hypothetical protein
VDSGELNEEVSAFAPALPPSKVGQQGSQDDVMVLWECSPSQV